VASDRNAGRLQIGTLAGFASEYLAGFNRNPQAERPGVAAEPGIALLSARG
jgi:hypothetical protein